MFLGYSDYHKGYKYLSPANRIYVADTVHFNEHEFPYAFLFSSQMSSSSYTSQQPLPLLPISESSLSSSSSSSQSSSHSFTSHNSLVSHSLSPLHCSSPSTISHPSSQSSPSSPPSSPPLPLTITHNMITRAKHGILNSKSLIAHQVSDTKTLAFIVGPSNEALTTITTTKLHSLPISTEEALANPD